MNPWDLLTWISAVVLVISSIVIFAYFVRDARQYIRNEREKSAGSASTPPR